MFNIQFKYSQFNIIFMLVVKLPEKECKNLDSNNHVIFQNKMYQMMIIHKQEHKEH